jgi:hypothetical protein
MKKVILIISLLSASLMQTSHASYICATTGKSLHADTNKLVTQGTEGSCDDLGFNNDLENSAYVKKYTLSNPNSPGCDLSVVMPGMPDMGGFLSGNLKMGIDLCSAMQEGLDFFSDEANKAVGGMFSEVEATVQDALNQFAADYADSMPNLVQDTLKLEANTTLEFELSEGETIAGALFEHMGNQTVGTAAEGAVKADYQQYEQESGIDVIQSGDWNGAKGATSTESTPSGYASNNMPSNNGHNAIPTFDSSGLVSAN